MPTAPSMNTDCATSGLGLEIGEREVADGPCGPMQPQHHGPAMSSASNRVPAASAITGSESARGWHSSVAPPVPIVRMAGTT